jgi:catechol 2,3-dioxygenase-like lactoylglutathione lyase family enzyme
MAASISFFDHVGLIVDDLETMGAFFTGLGFIRDDLGESSGTWPGACADRPSV